MLDSFSLHFGPMLIGTYFNAILYGVLVHQVLIYHQTENKMSLTKCLVLFLLLAETVDTALTISVMYQPLILDNGLPSLLVKIPTFLAAEPLMTVIISTSVQIFVIWRIRVISMSRWLPAVISVFAFASLGGGIWMTISVLSAPTSMTFHEFRLPALIWLMASAAADVVIAISLSVCLLRRRTGFDGTDNVINKIVRLTIQTGSITAIFAVLDVIFFLAFPNTALNFLWDFALSKLYTNALLSTLNARSGLNNMATSYKNSNDSSAEDDSPVTHDFSFANPRPQMIIASANADLGRIWSDKEVTDSRTKYFGVPQAF
ncbi:hypothetical protein BDQ12DRAFT_736344 [Crucibulum laeve]|uniref:DUF6534 domain-containing protein n=1 Tax=Crucibulum laeve TaxID=68775 RepID=A0A5C3LXQ3_9AGAR|nr:hypothetical protein BDQ12DRAFT_736344 [Crucibulum laeve]